MTRGRRRAAVKNVGETLLLEDKFERMAQGLVTPTYLREDLYVGARGDVNVA